METYFSASLGNCFCDSDLFAGILPADAVEITPEEHEALLLGRQNGKIITADADGRPVLSDPPPPTAEEILIANQATQSTLLATASQAMTPLLLSLQLGDATADETASAKAWQTYCRDLKAVDLTVSAPAWPAVPA